MWFLLKIFCVYIFSIIGYFVFRKIFRWDLYFIHDSSFSELFYIYLSLGFLGFLTSCLCVHYVWWLSYNNKIITFVVFSSISTALKENLYYEAGKILAISLVHGGPSPGFFSKTLFNCLVYGPENTQPILDDVSDFDVAQIIIRVRNILVCYNTDYVPVIFECKWWIYNRIILFVQ